jgi:hypothetical protein
MSKLDLLSLGMGGTSLLMHDTDTASNISGYAIQALEDCVFSEFVLSSTSMLDIDSATLQTITAVTHGDEEFTVADVTKYAVGDRVFITVAGTAPTGMPSPDSAIYYIQAATSDDNKFKLSRTKGGSAIAISSDGSGFEGAATIAKLKDQTYANRMGTFGIGGAANEIDIVPSDVSGNLDMFDTDGAESVQISAGMTVYLPITDLVLTTGACIVYTHRNIA